MPFSSMETEDWKKRASLVLNFSLICIWPNFDSTHTNTPFRPEGEFKALIGVTPNLLAQEWWCRWKSWQNNLLILQMIMIFWRSRCPRATKTHQTSLRRVCMSALTLSRGQHASYFRAMLTFSGYRMSRAFLPRRPPSINLPLVAPL